MQRRICPICDHVMTSAHYCRFCKQWVSNPNVVNATYYLNECHKEHGINEKKETVGSFEPDLHRQAEQRERRQETRRQEIYRMEERAAKSPRTGRNPDAAAAGKMLRLVISFVVLLFFVNFFLPLLLFFINVSF